MSKMLSLHLWIPFFKGKLRTTWGWQVGSRICKVKGHYTALPFFFFFFFNMSLSSSTPSCLKIKPFVPTGSSKHAWETPAGNNSSTTELFALLKIFSLTSGCGVSAYSSETKKKNCPICTFFICTFRFSSSWVPRTESVPPPACHCHQCFYFRTSDIELFRRKSVFLWVSWCLTWLCLRKSSCYTQCSSGSPVARIKCTVCSYKPPIH